MSIKSFKELIVWQKSINLAIEVYKITNNLPESEKFGLVSQLNRCAVSIPSNIAEGQQRNNTSEFRHFIGIARGSAAELETQLIIMENVYKIDSQKLLSELSEIQKMLSRLKANLRH